MATVSSKTSRSEAAILTRLVRPDAADLSSPAAEALAALRLDPADLARLHELTSKNQDDALSPEEREELESYMRIRSLVDLLHAKARRSLKNHP